MEPWTTAYPIRHVEKLPDTAKMSWDIEDVKNNARGNGHPSRIYDEAYLGLGIMKRILRLMGFFPIQETAQEEKGRNVIEGLRFRWNSCWLASTIFSLWAIVICMYFSRFHFTNYIADPSEKSSVSSYLMVMCISAAINLFSSLSQADNWPLYYRRWQIIDRLLDIPEDKELRVFVRRVLFGLSLVMIFSLSTAVGMVVIRHFLDEPAGPGFPIFTVLFMTNVITCHILPEAFFTCICGTIEVRLNRLSEELSHVMAIAPHGNATVEATEELEKLRIAYQLMVDSIRHINHIMASIFIVTLLINTYSLTLSAYFYIKQISASYNVKILKGYLGIISLVRLVPVCFYATRIRNTVMGISKILYKAETLNLSDNSFQEAVFFMESAKITEPSYTAAEFFSVDKGLLNTVLGVVLTYTITMLQFDDQQSSRLLLDDRCSNMTNITDISSTMISLL